METVLIDGANVVHLPAGVRAMTVHDATECAGRECVIHRPTQHSMRGFALHWRGDRGIFERICPHGVGHPDPDQKAYWHEQARRDRDSDWLHGSDEDELPDPDEHVAGQMTHGCDGCCAP